MRRWKEFRKIWGKPVVNKAKSTRLIHPFDDDRLHEECGVFGVFGHQDAAAHCVLGLHALQHRGQEAAGIVSCDAHHKDGVQFHHHMAFGKVGDHFNSQEIVGSLQGDTAVGHNRYSTSGTKKRIANVQPLFAEYHFGGMALAHNGNLTNAGLLRKELVAEGSIFRTSMDTEVVLHLMARSRKGNVCDALMEALAQIKGGYSMVLLARNQMIAVRDSLGIRPLVMGRLSCGAYVFASESCALDIIGAKIVRDVAPGEVIVLERDDGAAQHDVRMHSMRLSPDHGNPRFCIFEYVYFSRPDSRIEGKDVYVLRRNMGAQLALESGVEADIVVPVPDSGVPAAIGYSVQAGLPFELGIIRNHYVGRTFIEPTDQIRHLGVKLKHNANISALKGKRVVLIDDSIVRGTTSKKIVAMVREAGAKEVHMRISSPPTTDPCFYGVDTPSKDKLVAASMSVDEICEMIGADSLAFLSVDGLYKAVGEERRADVIPQYCDACFTGDYPVEISDIKADELPLFEKISGL